MTPPKTTVFIRWELFRSYVFEVPFAIIDKQSVLPHSVFNKSLNITKQNVKIIITINIGQNYLSCLFKFLSVF